MICKRFAGVFILSLIFVIILNFPVNHTIEANKDLKILVMTDPHYIANSLSDCSEGYDRFASPTDGKQLLYINDIMDAFVGEVIQENPDILIISGDLTCNGERESHIEFERKIRKIKKSGTKVYVIPGNHDIKNMWARGYKEGKPHVVESIDRKEFEKIYREYGYKEAISKKDNSLSYLAAPSKDLWLLMIDTNEYIDGEGMPTGKGTITPDTLEWIIECGELALEKGAKIIPVMHHNLLKHHETSSERSRVDCYKEAVKIFKQYGFDLSLTGHIHVQDIASCDADDVTIYEISTSSLVIYPHQYGKIDYSPNSNVKYKTKRLNIEQWAQNNNIESEILLNFHQYTKDNFFELNYYRALGELMWEDGLSEEDADKVAILVADIMLRYYEGTVHFVREDIITSPEYSYILNTNSDILYELIYSVMQRAKDISSYLEIVY